MPAGSAAWAEQNRPSRSPQGAEELLLLRTPNTRLGVQALLGYAAAGAMKPGRGTEAGKTRKQPA